MSIAARLAVGLMRIAYAPIRLFPQKNRIAILSRQSEDKSADIKALEKYISGKYPDIGLTVLVRMVDGIGYAFHMLRQMHAIATSRVVVVDGYCIAVCVLRHKPGTKIIQIWHSSAAIKKFGYQTLDKPEGHSSETAKAMHMHENYDYVVAPSCATGRLFCRGFNTSEDKIRLYGLPRLEKISAPADDRWLNETRTSLGLDDGRETVLYVPTLRRVREVEALPLLKALDPGRYRLVVCLHPLDELFRCNSDEAVKDNGNPPSECASEDAMRLQEAIRLGSLYGSTQWLKLCDHIVTDYSAMGVEAAILDKPMYFYAYDIEDYEKETGLNINPLEEMSWCSSVDAHEIARMIEGAYDFGKLKAFRDKYIEVNPVNCTEKLAEFIVETVNGNN